MNTRDRPRIAETRMTAVRPDAHVPIFTRVYRVPGHLVRAGKNTIAVRVFCNLNNAGMTGPAA